MLKTEKHLRRAISKGVNKRIILDNLSDEIRLFLSNLIGTNCNAMTALEFAQLDYSNFNRFNSAQIKILCSFSGSFFRTLDDVRFSGADISIKTINLLLDDLYTFLTTLKNSEKNKQKEEKKS